MFSLMPVYCSGVFTCFVCTESERVDLKVWCGFGVESSSAGFWEQVGEIVCGALTLRRDLGVWKLSLLSNLHLYNTQGYYWPTDGTSLFTAHTFCGLAFSPDNTLPLFSLSFPSLPYRWHWNTDTHTEELPDIRYKENGNATFAARPENTCPQNIHGTVLCNPCKDTGLIIDILWNISVVA